MWPCDDPQPNFKFVESWLDLRASGSNVSKIYCHRSTNTPVVLGGTTSPPPSGPSGRHEGGRPIV